jgi:hypothetical protein
VVASKSGEWSLEISGDGTLQWRVHLASGWATAKSSRVLRNGSSYVVKATHAGSIVTGRGACVCVRVCVRVCVCCTSLLPVICTHTQTDESLWRTGTLKIFSCELAAVSFACPLSTVEGSATGLLPLQSGTADIILGGAEQQHARGYDRDRDKDRDRDRAGHERGDIIDASTSFVGAMEEIQLARISLENITAHLYLGNAYPMCPSHSISLCILAVNFAVSYSADLFVRRGRYLFDYTNPAARKYWADSVAAIYNEAGAVCGQWDGSEFQSSVAGWGMPHSSQTWSAGADALFWATLGVHTPLYKSLSLATHLTVA